MIQRLVRIQKSGRVIFFIGISKLKFCIIITNLRGKSNFIFFDSSEKTLEKKGRFLKLLVSDLFLDHN